MNHYLMKYKGTYRILPELDITTHDIPRDRHGNIAEGYDDLYIACRYGNKIFAYGVDDSKRMVLSAYIPSIGRGRNIRKALDEMNIPYFNYVENDEEVEFRFKAKDIEPVASLLKAKTSGANINPFSVKNLPKAKNVEIPLEEIERYKVIAAQVSKEDLLIIHKLTTKFLDTVLTKKYKALQKDFDVKSDMKVCLMSRLAKEYIYTKGMWNEYLDYLTKEINKFYKNCN